MFRFTVESIYFFFFLSWKKSFVSRLAYGEGKDFQPTQEVQSHFLVKSQAMSIFCADGICLSKNSGIHCNQEQREKKKSKVQDEFKWYSRTG